jgi:hypothetical protein
MHRRYTPRTMPAKPETRHVDELAPHYRALPGGSSANR